MVEGPAAEARVVALPWGGSVIHDQRGGGRWMRVTWHDDVAVLSFWRDTGCVGTLRVARHEVPALVSALVDGLAEPAAAPTAGPTAAPSAGPAAASPPSTGS